LERQQINLFIAAASYLAFFTSFSSASSAAAKGFFFSTSSCKRRSCHILEKNFLAVPGNLEYGWVPFRNFGLF
jgi:hypothetical protein